MEVAGLDICASVCLRIKNPNPCQKNHTSQIKNTSLGFRQFYEFLEVDWATFLTYSLNMECTYFLKARELPC